MTFYIGDVHGFFEYYEKLIRGLKNTVQVGDMRVGYKNAKGKIVGMEGFPIQLMAAGGHKFIHGNHDNLSECLKYSTFIPDGHFENDTMYVGGAASTDRKWRTEGQDWWADEELSILQFNEVMDSYVEKKPAVMVTHDCPEEVFLALCEATDKNLKDWPSRTRQAFQVMFEQHQPKAWVFGHHHRSFDKVISGTRFVCLDELEVKEIVV